MNCLEFRRAKLSDPRRMSPDAHGHVAGCEECARFAATVDETETRVADVLNVHVPEGLAERVLLHRRRSMPRWSAWALAASLALGIALGLQALRPASSDEYARGAIRHVLAEPELLQAEQDPDPAALSAMFSDLGGTLNASIGRVRYMGPCPEAPAKAWHVVFEGPDGIATLILVREPSVRASQSASDSGLNALVQPAPRGYYVVVTRSPAATASVDQLIRQRVHWHPRAGAEGGPLYSLAGDWS